MEHGTPVRPSSPPPSSLDAPERRRRRSDDPLVALHYQLSSTRARGRVDAIVLADFSGVVVAGAGSWPVCEELAAYAPLLADAGWAVTTDTVSSRVEMLRRELVVLPVTVAGQDVLLCARRQKRGDAAQPTASAQEERDLTDAAAGVTRILSAAA